MSYRFVIAAVFLCATAAVFISFNNFGYSDYDNLIAEETLEPMIIQASIAPATPTPTPLPTPTKPPSPLDGMSIYEKVGQLVIARMPTEEKAQSLIEDYHIGGFILFREHISGIEQVQQLIADMQGKAAIPLFISVDEEGGRVSRIGHLFERSATAYRIGQTGDLELASNTYYQIGEKLTYLGFNMNFAPVADIWTNSANTVIGDRAFGKEPELVAEMVQAAIEGLQDASVLSVIKHFPGHGDTAEDSHYLMAFYNHDRTRFDEVESVPFARGIEAGTDGIMVGHIATPYLDPENSNLPATFSYYLMQQVLRKEMGFEGLIITDALDMRGLTNYYSDSDIVINAFINGADVLLMPSNPQQAIAAIIEAYYSGHISEERINESVSRILHAKQAFS